MLVVCLPLKHGSDRHETSPKRVSDDSRHFIFRRKKFFSKLRTAVYPPKMAPIGVKLRENAFQVIPDISFFDQKNFFRNFERLFTPRGWLCLASNFWKTRVRWSPTFHFSTAQTLFATKIFVAKNFSSTVRKCFQQSACFGVAVQVYTPMSNAAREFIARTSRFSLLRPLAEG